MENRLFLMEIVRSITMAVLEQSVNSQERPMELINVVKRVHYCSSVDGSGSVIHIPKPSSMNRQR